MQFNLAGKMGCNSSTSNVVANPTKDEENKEEETENGNSKYRMYLELSLS